jgi:hypothetical protein
MKRRVLFRVLLAWAWLAPLGAQEPGPLATPTQKLDHLLSQWRGQSVEHVREVWGREDDLEMRGTNPVLVYEKRVKVRPSFGGITVNPNGGLRCVVRFLISDTEEVLRVARQGGGAECWNAWRKFEP